MPFHGGGGASWTPLRTIATAGPSCHSGRHCSPVPTQPVISASVRRPPARLFPPYPSG
ncbi:hypothetical protein GA0070623_0687 [Micromonospora rifamycinica]|uniref:Uncharacterized protein n=1 Tax=Micromonospora rifamycinica TaxID=291594 RepID=A0A1C5H3J9_9ACTN|nr:hypothetical protein GA0070623_0687 [Micromonospora rifamycinica]